MKPLVKTFIESHKGFILHEDWDNMYDEAYEQLPDDHVRELTRILTQTLGIPMEDYAKENLLKHFLIELNNFKVDKQHKELLLTTFIRMYMSHLQGVHYVDFADLVSSELESNPVKGIQLDLDSDLDIIIRKKGR